MLHSLRVTQEEHRSNERVIYNLHPEARDTGRFDGGDTAVVMIQYGDVEIPEDRTGEFFGLLPPSEDEIVEERVRETTERADLPAEMDVTITGTPVSEETAFGMLLPEMIELFAIALGVILEPPPTRSSATLGTASTGPGPTRAAFDGRPERGGSTEPAGPNEREAGPTCVPLLRVHTRPT